MTSISKNDYYKLSPWFIGACMSISRGSTKKYKMIKTEEKKGFYLFLSQGPITLKVPFRALFDTNDKIKPIVSLSFISALECPSEKRGLCQLAKSGESCYAKNGARQASGTFITSGQFKGAPCLNSYYNSCLVQTCIDIIKQDQDIFKRFISYVQELVPILRFNLKGDFRTLEDYYFILKVALLCPNTIVYGYSARDDLLAPVRGFYLVSNFYLNGSNNEYTNRFKACYDLKKWLTSSKICLGGCTGCKKCYNFRGESILCLVHGKNQDQDLNTWLNRVFLCKLFNALNSPDSPVLEPEDLQVKKGLLESLNYQLTNKLGIKDLEFKDYWTLRAWLQGLHYEVQDNMELIRNVEYLKALGVA